MIEESPGLYGLTATNTNRTGKDLWGKNQFNSTFPLALCLKMRDDNIKPIYVSLDQEFNIRASDQNLSMDEVMGMEKETVYYKFESAFSPYESFVDKNNLEKIDLVVLCNENPIHPLEVKLTVVPDSTTATDDEASWGPEMVVRPISSAYAMMGLAHKLHQPKNLSFKRQVDKSRRGRVQTHSWME